jgi:hypothetical protein
MWVINLSLISTNGVAPNQSLQLPGRPSRAGTPTARSAAFSGTLLATAVSCVCQRVTAAAAHS